MIKRLFCIIILLPVFTTAEGRLLSASGEKRHILILNSYNRGFPWTDAVMNTLEKFLNESGMDTELHVEYMDTKRYSGRRYFELLYSQYKYKYSSMRMDCVIAVDDDALNFLLEYHDSLFPAAPVVFCGINDLEIPAHINRKVYTGIMEEESPRSTIDLVMKLHPSAKSIYVICDNTTTGRVRYKSMNAVINSYSGIKFIFSRDMPFNTMLMEISSLPANTPLLLLAYYRDGDGTYYTYENVMRSIYAVSAMPVYSVAVNYLGYGVTGGVMNNPETQAGTAAAMCIRVLNGEKPSSIDIIEYIKNPVMMDYRVMTRFGIKEEILPAGTIFINKPGSFMDFFKANRIYLLYIISFFMTTVVIILTVSVILIWRSDRKRRKVLGDLGKALTHVKTLSGLLPICSSCRKIRNDSGYWQLLDIYIGEHSDVEFTHSLCPDCARRLYPDIFPDSSDKK